MQEKNSDNHVYAQEVANEQEENIVVYAPPTEEYHEYTFISGILKDKKTTESLPEAY